MIQKEHLITAEGLTLEQADRVLSAYIYLPKGEKIHDLSVATIREKFRLMTAEGPGRLSVEQAQRILRK